MWVRVTPADIAEAREDLTVRRAELLARHAIEREALDADAAQIAALSALVEGFIAKFKAPAAEAWPPAPAILVAKQQEPGGDGRSFSLEVAGFDRVVLPGEARLAPSDAAVAIDFDRSRSKSAVG